MVIIVDCGAGGADRGVMWLYMLCNHYRLLVPMQQMSVMATEMSDYLLLPHGMMRAALQLALHVECSHDTWLCKLERHSALPGAGNISDYSGSAAGPRQSGEVKVATSV